MSEQVNEKFRALGKEDKFQPMDEVKRWDTEFEQLEAQLETLKNKVEPYTAEEICKIDQLTRQIDEINLIRSEYAKKVLDGREKRKALFTYGMQKICDQLPLVSSACTSAMLNGSSCPDMLDSAQEEVLRLLDIVRYVSHERRKL